ncbi:MAG: DUF1570 domain-containing protein [Planctomycetaceae bacterium]|nr:DUF1570 domain-containing protein [Planctomycetaceae bacterium]
MRILWGAVAVVGCVAAAWADEPSGAMVELSLHGRTIEGTPLSWNRQEVRLLGRDGRLWRFPPQEAVDFKKTSERFQSYSPSEFRASLLRELGPDYEVTGTDRYLIAHPRGQRDRWAQRFEDLYRAFVHYFSVRGFTLSTPPFPLVGVVCANRSEFARWAAAQSGASTAGVQGYYDLASNRIALYDMGGRAESGPWQQNASVLIHEAAHQTAFNTGVQNRFAPPPMWVAEGLAMLFEAPGVYDPDHHPRIEDRVNRQRLDEFRRRAATGHRPESILALVTSDAPFQTDTLSAYAEAWALSFFLAETEPRRYADYLQRVARRPAFRRDSAAERRADFEAVFGGQWRMLEARFLKFLDRFQ